MAAARPRIPLARARRIALRAAGLAGPRPRAGTRLDVRHLRAVTDRLGVVQLDSVNVLAPAHELPFFSRLGIHDRGHRDRWLWRSRELIEGWAHVASLTPVDRWPLLAHRRRAFREGASRARFEREHPGELEAVLREVAEAGPTSVRDLADAGGRTGPWWGNPRGKRALQHLFLGGELAVDHRTPTLVTHYDLSARVVPGAFHDAVPPSPEQAALGLLRHAVRAQGLGTAADLADHHRQPVGPTRRLLDRMVAQGELEAVEVEGWGRETVYLDPTASTPREAEAHCLVSPFDPLIWFRPRTLRLFDLHYRIEIYVPAARRRYGYYVLPLLVGDRFVARVDLRADRRRGRLQVRSAFTEPDGDGRTDHHGAARLLAEELALLATWLRLDDIEVADRGDLAPALAHAI